MNLKREVNFFGVFSLAVGSMISSGIFILPSLAFARSGPSAIASYVIAGILAMVGSFAIIELATAMPKAGGDYYFINRSLGPLLGTFSGILGWLALSLKSAFAVFGICEVIYILIGVNQVISAAFVVLFFVLLNFRGAKEAARLQIILVAFLLLLLFAFVGISLPSIDAERYSPFFTNGTGTTFLTAGFVFISFGGLLKVANLAEEIENPKRNIPLGMISSIIVVTILYALVMVALTGILTPEQFSSSLAPVADAAGIKMGKAGYILMTIAASFAFITTANAGILASSRYPFSLARDGLLPGIFVKTNKKGMPIVAITITGIIIFVSLLFDLVSLVKVASAVILVSYVLTNISVLVLRESKLKSYKPTFIAPMYPFLQITSILIFSYLIINMGTSVIQITIMLIIGCILLYIFYGNKNSTGESAFLHLLRRIADERLTNQLLETELEEIVNQRDGLYEEFKPILENAKVFEIEGYCDFEDMLEDIFSDKKNCYKLDKDYVVSEFIKREEEGSTVLNDEVAIPHIITDKVDEMKLIIVRNKDGIKFNRQDSNVKAIFCLIGRIEDRDKHLLSISMIARKARETEFFESWMNDSLEDIIKNW
ncbi:MAG: amino acid permease [Spirochaetaceae bacterium]|nr:amino acid permease [Spirochaetaceae bacterium]